MLKFAFLTFLLAAAAPVFSAEYGKAPVPSETINIWPGDGKAPGDVGEFGAERVRFAQAPALPQKEVFNVTVPQLEIFRPAAGKANGLSVVILPGGGFGVLKMDYEGEDAAVWLQNLGVTAIILKHRVPQREGMPRWMPAAQDAQRAVSLVRSKAAEWKIDPARIGLMGFSAGGIALAVACNSDGARLYPHQDAVDDVAFMPDWTAPIYCGTILAEGKLLPEIKVNEKTPPAFMVVSDKDHSEFSIAYYLALKEKGVSSELHIYADGVHGFGMRPSEEPHATWTARMEDWLKWRKLMAAPAAATAEARP